MILKRLKNLWALSAYTPTQDTYGWSDRENPNVSPILRKTITTVEARPATILDLEAKDPFEDDNSDK